MNRLLLDLNVLLDVILDRAPDADAAAALWAALERGQGEGVLPADGVTTVYYLLEKARGAAFARRGVALLLRVFSVAAVDGEVLHRALTLEWPDFEDAVCAAAAEASNCAAIVTRDAKGFRNTPVPIVDPAAALALLTN